MTTVAPVCPISRDQAVSGMPGIQLPAAPRALDLPSLILAVNALRLLLQNVINPIGVPQPNLRLNTAQQQGGMAAVKPDWFEVDRTLEHKRVYHKDPKTGKQDPNMFVDVERINQVVFEYTHGDPHGEKFYWRYKKGQQ